jgi:hypothetical protein
MNDEQTRTRFETLLLPLMNQPLGCFYRHYPEFKPNVRTGLAFLFLLLGEFRGSRGLILEVQTFPLPVDFPAIEVTLVAFVARTKRCAILGLMCAQVCSVFENWQQVPQGLKGKSR